MSDIYVLGINVSHDISCALLKNGDIFCAITEERLNRIKRFSGGIDSDGMTHNRLPFLGIKYCTDSAGIRLRDVDLIVVSTCVVVNYSTYEIRDISKEEIMKQLPGYVDPNKVHIIGHHLGHAASAFYPTKFDDAAIIVVDGGGNLLNERYDSEKEHANHEERITIYHGRNGEIRLRKRYLDNAPSGRFLSNKRHCSLGDLYQSATIFAGFGTGDEGKTMGLAPYGSGRYYEDFEDAVKLENGKLTIKGAFQFNKLKNKKQGYYGGQFGAPRKQGETLRQTDKDIAAAAQHVLERTLIAIANEAHTMTGSRNLCLAGGVALNSVANKKILDKTPFKNIFVQPAASDDGCALGNALYGWITILDKQRIWQMGNAYLGRIYSDDEILAAVEQYKGWCSILEVDDVVKKTAQLISEKRIVGWFQGGSEFGPRALGNRSILCDSRFDDMKDTLNKKVKHREGFRPFAPAILEEYSDQYFDLNCPSPFMLLIAEVKKPDDVPAVTHIDNTARVQTVTKEENDKFYDLIKEYHKITGVPLVLNTSFNVAGEPIVETPQDAIRCFLSTQIDFLVLGNVLLQKRSLKCKLLKTLPQELKRVAYSRFKPHLKRLPLARKMRRHFRKSHKGNIEIPG